MTGPGPAWAADFTPALACRVATAAAVSGDTRRAARDAGAAEGAGDTGDGIDADVARVGARLDAAAAEGAEDRIETGEVADVGAVVPPVVVEPEEIGAAGPLDAAGAVVGAAGEVAVEVVPDGEMAVEVVPTGEVTPAETTGEVAEVVVLTVVPATDDVVVVDPDGDT